MQTDSILLAFADTFAVSDLGRLDKADRELLPDLGSSSITKVMGDLGAITPTDSIASVWKEVLELAIEKWASTDTTVVLSSSDTAKLMDIALLCPYRFGPAVYRARGLLFTPDSAWFAIRNECEFGAEPIEPSMRLAEPETEEGADAITDTHAKVYPNPTTGTLHIDLFYDDKDIATWRMIDLTGRTVHTGPVSSGQSQQVTDMSVLRSGVYLLQLQLNGVPEKVWRIVLTGTDSR